MLTDRTSSCEKQVAEMQLGLLLSHPTPSRGTVMTNLDPCV